MSEGAVQHAMRLSVVVPVFREEASIAPFLARLLPVLRGMGGPFEVIFALDPSPDRTEAVIEDAIARHPEVRMLRFSRRFGQPAATMAGLLECSGEHCVVIDVDLQDPPELIPELLARAQEGYDVVYARRRSRAGETLVKRAIAAFGYGLIHRLGALRIPRNTGDFRLLSRRVVEHLRAMPDQSAFLRGLVAYVGFPQAAVDYDRDAREAGQGHYNRLTGSITIGLNGLIGFSNRPLQLIWVLGLGLCLVAGLGVALALLHAVWPVVPGWPLSAEALLHLLLAGLQLFCLGLVGEYIGRVHDEVLRRPRYIIERRVNFPPAQREKGSDGAGSA